MNENMNLKVLEKKDKEENAALHKIEVQMLTPKTSRRMTKEDATPINTESYETSLHIT